MLIGAETVFVATADPKRSRIALLAENVGPELHRLWPTLIALRHENAAISYHMSHPDGPALMIEDIMPMSQWKRTAVFNEFYDKLGMRARLSLSLSIGRPDITGIVAHRAHGTFTERHRFILNLLGLHISQACANTKLQHASLAPVLGALESIVGASIVALDAAGKVQFCSDQAQQYFESFFAKERPFHNGLPPTVKAWALHEFARLNEDEFGLTPFLSTAGAKRRANTSHSAREDARRRGMRSAATCRGSGVGIGKAEPSWPRYAHDRSPLLAFQRQDQQGDRDYPRHCDRDSQDASERHLPPTPS